MVVNNLEPGGAIIYCDSPPFSMQKDVFQRTFGKSRDVLIGMIHLPPLLSVEGYSGMQPMIEGALADLKALEEAGFDGALVENDDDKPHTEFANEAQIACLTAVALEVCRNAHVPIGVQMMLNDWKSSFAIATAVGAAFTRLDVFVDNVHSEWGDITPVPEEIMEYKERIAPELLLLTDIQVKYKTMMKLRPLSESARLAIEHGSGGLIVTGAATGVETPLRFVEEVHDAFPDFPVLIGAGVNAGNVREQLGVANGAIVGTSLKTGGRIDPRKAALLKGALGR